MDNAHAMYFVEKIPGHIIEKLRYCYNIG